MRKFQTLRGLKAIAIFFACLAISSIHEKLDRIILDNQEAGKNWTLIFSDSLINASDGIVTTKKVTFQLSIQTVGEEFIFQKS